MMKPVIFIPGFFISLTNKDYIKAEFEKNGCSFFNFDAGFNVRDIKTTAKELNDFVEKVCNENGLSSVILVGYSLGGLIACYYFNNFGRNNRVNKIICVATPFAGTWLAYAAFVFKAARQMFPGCEFLNNLVQKNTFSHNLISIYAGADKIVRPKTSCILPGAKNIEIPRVGHLDIFKSQETWTRIEREI